jgi:hypothetical protein
MTLVAELSGWLGALVVLAGYTAFSLGGIANGRLFQACNLSGSAALILNGAYHGAWPSVALNVAWATISSIALLRVLRAGRSAASIGVVPAPAARLKSPICEE